MDSIRSPGSRKENRSAATNSDQGEASETATTTRTQESSSSSSVARQEKITPIVIDGQGRLLSVAFLAGGKLVVSRGQEPRIRRWQVDDGKEMETLVDAESVLYSLGASRDGKWIAGGTKNGFVEVWNAETNEKVKSWKAHGRAVSALDLDQDETRVISGSHDKTACVWIWSTGQRRLGPLKHDNTVTAAKFSPDGRLIATATWHHESIQIHNGRDGSLLVNVPIRAGSSNSSLAWTGDSKRLFAASYDGLIHCLDASTGATLAKWPIQGNQGRCIALINNGAFIAACSGSTLSLWDTSSQTQVGSTLCLTHQVWSMAISDNLHLAVCGDKKLTLCNLCEVLPTPYIINETLNGLKELRAQLAESRQARQQRDDLIHVLNTRIVELENATQDLASKLSNSQGTAENQSRTIESLRTDFDTQRTSSNGQIQDLRKQLDSCSRERDDANLLLRTQEESSNMEITRLEQDNQKLRDDQTRLKQVSESLRDDLHTRETNLNAQNQDLRAQLDSLNRIVHMHEQKHQCEVLYAQGRIFDAVESFLEVRTISEDVKAGRILVDWLSEFPQRCIKTLEKVGDDASTAGKSDETIAAYAAALSLDPPSLDTILTKWSHAILAGRSVHDALNLAAKLNITKSVVYQNFCNVLEEDGHLTEAVECFRQMKNEFPEHTIHDEQRMEWEHRFRERCTEKLVKLGDTASNVKKREDAVRYYTEAISIQPEGLNEILLKRGNELVDLDPLSYKGYEEKHIALNGMGRYGEAFESFQSMLSILEQLPDPRMHELRQQYLDVTPLIQQVVQQTTTPMPRLLIDTETGRLYDKTQQAAMFKESPIYDELRSLITKRAQLDLTRIQDEVKSFYRYVMFSHRWEVSGEPVLRDVQNSTIYILEATSPNIKLQSLCRIVRNLGFKWVWSDTCCIDKKDSVVLQESLVAMFSWYRGSALTLVHLRGVWSHSQKPGHLRRSVWNSRVWTYQEYLAAEVVQFYTEDWKPYLDLNMFNHKESLAIIEEMEPESGMSSRELAVLQPGLDRIREKLSLASARETTLQEDIAYSLLGIFHASIPVIYGEGDRALGRLLEHLLTGSGDVSVLAWTGSAGGYNSCLPADLGVYEQVIPPHIPPPIETGEMDRVVARLRSSQLDHTLLGTLYHRLRYLPKLRMAASRLELPGIVFQIPKPVCTLDPDPKTRIGVYRSTTSIFGDIEIRTADDLSGMTDLVLVHPWIRPLFHQEFLVGAGALDRTTQALRLFARFQQPFGALLLQQLTLMEYKRVAADCLIMVQVREEMSLADLIDSVTTVEVQ